MSISTMKVRDVALEMPQATRVFEELRIDYCCKGDTPVSEACATAGIEVAKLEQMLAEAGAAQAQQSQQTIDFQKATLTELVKYILDKHHVYTKDEMARLEPLTEKVIGAHGTNHSELTQVGRLVRDLCADLEPHMFKEEQMLFPYIIEMERSALQKGPAPVAPFGTVKNPVRMMMLEHDTVGGILHELRSVTSNYAVPTDGCISYHTLYRELEAFERDLHQHIHLENNILFPRAIILEEKG